MPVNAGPEYFKASQKFQAARTIEEKISALEEMIKFLPKHKGSHNVLAQLRARLARLKKEKLAGRRKKSARKAFSIKKEGAAQVSIIGFPGAGKSQLLKSLTGVGQPSEIPYSTKTPVVGMMRFEDVQIQLVEIPSSFSAEYVGTAHNSDLVIVLIDLSNPELDRMRNILEEENFRKYLIVGNKCDVAQAESGFSLVVSAKTGDKLDELKRMIWSALGLIRIYTKTPGKPAETKPMTLRIGATVRDVCEDVHKDFVRDFRFARIWGSSQFAGAQAGLEHVLKDKDVVEIHTR